MLVSRLTPFNQHFNSTAQNIARALQHRAAIGPVHALSQAYSIIRRQVQATMLAYIDFFWLLAILCGCMVPLVFNVKPNKPGVGPAPAH